jgi:hypothetical protein
MCVQCMMGAMSAGAAATGTRAWLRTRLTPKVLRRVTISLLVAGLCTAALIPGSSPSPSANQAPPAQHSGR